jgi:transposase, IS4 family
MRRLYRILSHTPLLEAKGDRPLQMEFEHQLKALIFYHLEEYSSGIHLVQALEEDEFAKKEIAPPEGIKKSSFSEAVNHRGLEQLLYIFEKLQADAAHTLPKEYAHLGDLVSIDGSLIDAVLSMHWADYRDGSKKAKAHLGFNVNNSIPQKIFLTDGKGDERPFVSKILSPGQTGIMDRYYQRHRDFDLWQTEGKHFVCRIKKKTNKTVIETKPVSSGSIIFYDATVLLGTPNVNQTIKPVRLVGYRVDGKKYWVATDRYDITAEEVACIYKLRWDIEIFFGWWKRHLKVYHLIARSQYGLMVQILGGLITYLLITIYCHNNFNEKVSIKRVRELRIKIKNEASNYDFFACGAGKDQSNTKKQKKDFAYAKT